MDAKLWDVWKDLAVYAEAVWRPIFWKVKMEAPGPVFRGKGCL